MSFRRTELYYRIVDIPGYLIYLITLSGTPGPNTILSLQNASQKGLRKGIFLNYGMLTGITVITTAAYFLITLLSSLLPSLSPVLQALSIVYILYLAWKIYRKSPVENADGDAKGSFRRGFLLQLINVKVLMLCVSAISTYILPSRFTTFTGLLVSMAIPLVCFTTGLVWAAAGEALKKIYNDHRRGANIIFSLSLVVLAFRSAYALIRSF